MTTPKKGDNPTPEQQAVINGIAKWIDTEAIAMSIAEELVDLGYEVTEDNLRKVWLGVLDNLSDTLRIIVHARL
ncbi:MAG: hypothetical protein AABZ77_09445 [Chloroflexota bacterium]